MDALPHWDLSSLDILAELLNSNFLSLSATHKNSVSFLELFIAIYDTQQKVMLSLIIIGYLSSLLFYSEISRKTIVL